MSNDTNVARALFTVVPSNTVNFTRTPRLIYVGTGGDVSVVDAEGTSVTFVGVPGGYEIKARLQRINATGTTASNMVGHI